MDQRSSNTDSANWRQAPRSWRRGSANAFHRQGRSAPVGTSRAAHKSSISDNPAAHSRIPSRTLAAPLSAPPESTPSQAS